MVPKLLSNVSCSYSILYSCLPSMSIFFAHLIVPYRAMLEIATIRLYIFAAGSISRRHHSTDFTFL